MAEVKDPKMMERMNKCREAKLAKKVKQEEVAALAAKLQIENEQLKEKKW